MHEGQGITGNRLESSARESESIHFITGATLRTKGPEVLDFIFMK